MSSLKVIKNRIRSVNNTKKITQTMKLVSAAKYSRAEKELLSIRTFGQSPQHFFDSSQVRPPSESPSNLILVLTGDRGLCGAIHSGIAKAVSTNLKQSPENVRRNTKLICIGDKNRVILSRAFPENIIWVASEVGKKPPTFLDASAVAETTLETMQEDSFTRIQIFFNKFVNASMYTVTSADIYDRSAIYSAPKFALYDMVDEETIDCWLEFSLVAMIFWMLKEGSVSELSARMSAMENATKNASDMNKYLTLQYNRTRQAVITRELIEIISGASAI